jgi:hypothetical protein
LLNIRIRKIWILEQLQFVNRYSLNIFSNHYKQVQDYEKTNKFPAPQESSEHFPDQHAIADSH